MTIRTTFAELGGKLRRRFKKMHREKRFHSSVRHLHGPRQAPEGVTVIALVRDGMFYLDAFLRHYRNLGASHFVFCDNGSSDGTIDRLKCEADCSVLQSLLPWGEVENDLRRHAAETYTSDQWCLFADMDEIFTFDGAEQIGLDGLTRYLDMHGHTALVAQMLDLFPKMPLQEAGQLSYEEALDEFVYYDLRDIQHFAYHDPDIGFAYYLHLNSLSDAGVEILFGGVRRRVFGEMCCLTKHPLVRVTKGVQPGVHPHVAANVVCSDFTGLIKHYKFANAPAARDADTVARGVIPHGEDAKRLNRFRADPDLTLWTEDAQRLGGLLPLQLSGFLHRSESFHSYLDDVTG